LLLPPVIAASPAVELITSFFRIVFQTLL